MIRAILPTTYPINGGAKHPAALLGLIDWNLLHFIYMWWALYDGGLKVYSYHCFQTAFYL